jgi:hypothetical protein
MESQGSSTNSNERRLERAVKYVQGLWLPVNGEVLERVRSGLDEGRYDLDPSFLVQELKSDIGLYLFCIRELAQIERQTNQPIPQNPGTLLQAAGVERLKRLLKVDAERISRHELTSANVMQLSQLQGAMVSAATAETLGERVSIDSEFAFSTAVLRQLGILLVAWNYPTVYQRALAAQGNGKTLDDVVLELAGFSPSALAIRLVREWGLSSQVRYAMGGENAIDPEERFEILAVEEATAQLEEICRVGEALARANDPQNHPEALHDWDTARAEIERILGQEGMQLIQARMRQFAVAYQNAHPQLSQRLTDIHPDRQLKEHREHLLLKNNPFVQQCPLQLRKRLKDFYGQVNPQTPTRDQVAFLIKQVVPYAGFSAGAVLTIDPGTEKLVARLKFGASPVRPFSTVDINTPVLLEDPCITALKCNNPITGQDESGTVSFIVGSLGDQQRVGVLYVELPRMLMSDSASNYLLHFKAIRQAFHDCLRLR